MKRTTFLLVLLLSAPVAAAQGLDPDKALTQYVRTVWQMDDGLPHGTIYDILQTQDGYLWLATEGGLARFDGVSFTVFNKSNTPAIARNRITSLAEAPDGTLWIGSYGGGLVRYREGQFTSFPIDYGPSSNNIWSLDIAEDGDVWIATLGGWVYRFNGKGFARYDTSDGVLHLTVWSVLADERKRVWVGTNRGVVRFAAGDTTHYRRNIRGPAATQVRAIEPSADGGVWLGLGNSGGLYRLRSGTLEPYLPEMIPGIVQAIYEDSLGTLWVGTSGGGIVRITTDDDVERLTVEDGMPSNTVTSFYQDREGSLWIGTDAGLVQLRDGAFTTYGEAQGIPWVGALREGPQGRMLVSLGYRLVALQNGRFVPYELPPGVPPDGMITMALDEEGHLWLGAACGGLAHVRAYRATAYTYNDNGLGASCIRAFAPVAEGDMWIGTDGGAGLYHFLNGRFIPPDSTALPTYVRSLLRDTRGRLWIGTWKGLWLLHGDSLQTLTPVEEISGDMIYSLHESPDGTIWVGADGGGLGRIRGDSVRVFTTSDGLYNDVIHGIVEDDEGRLWMSSSRGIFYVTRENLRSYAEGRAEHIQSTAYTEADGLLDGEGAGGQPSAWRASDGRLWFATEGGAAVIDPYEVAEPLPPPPVEIERLVVNGEPAAMDEEIELAPSSEDFEIHYTGLSFVQPEAMRFRYRLEGREEDWVAAGDRRTAFYTDLEPGNYTFHVQAANSDGVWNEKAAALSFYVQPHFYETWWFYLLAALALLALAFAGYRARVRHLTRRERVLEETVFERTEQLQQEKKRTETLYEQVQEENARKTQELEEARALQLSMLPAEPPSVNGVDIAVFMGTATEVGGDYYDFHVGKDGTLTVALGDATGHGMKAGLVVATTKSYFQTLADKDDNLEIVRTISKGIKEMKLSKMYMALMLLKYKEGSARLLAAGIPPALLYRQAYGTVEAVKMRGMPLGSFPDFPYGERAFRLNPGDTLLLMSDGLMEQFNDEREMLGLEAVTQTFSQAAPNGPEAVIRQLRTLAEQWANGAPQNDDITLIVLRVKK